MKLSILFIVASLFIFMSSCDKDSKQDVYGYPAGVETGDLETENDCSLEECSEDRIVRYIANDVKGVIRSGLIGNVITYGIIYAFTTDSYLSFRICDLPQEFQIDGLKVKYSGKLYDACGVKEAVWPTEEVYLLKLTKIEKQ